MSSTVGCVVIVYIRYRAFSSYGPTSNVPDLSIRQILININAMRN